jgi:hypothetical protein
LLTPVSLLNYEKRACGVKWLFVNRFVGSITRSEVHLIPDDAPVFHLLSHLRTKNSEKYSASFREHPGISISVVRAFLFQAGMDHSDLMLKLTLLLTRTLPGMQKLTIWCLGVWKDEN